MNKKGIAIFTHDKKEQVEDKCSVFLNDPAFEILDIKFSTAHLQHNMVCYSAMVYYNEIIDDKEKPIINKDTIITKKTTYEIRDNTEHQSMEGLASLFD